MLRQATRLFGFDGGGSPTLHGWYVEAGVTLTGERRPYNRAFGIFGGLSPDRPFLGDGPAGPGAIELLARYDALDLDDGAVAGGTIGNSSVGVNWVWTDRIKLQGNYVLNRLDRDGVSDARTQIVALRLQFSY